MHSFLQSLYDDHDHILKLLAVFERELGIFEDAGDPDYEILESSIEYCAEYMDAVHHRKEEQMLDQLRQHNAEAAAELEDLTEQHHALEQLTHEVSRAFADARDDTFTRREDMVIPARKWLQAYREHLHWEENNMFNVALKELSDADWDAAHANWEHVVNPLHQSAKDVRFSQLANAIVEFANS